MRGGFVGTWDSTRAVLLGGLCVGPSSPGRGLFSGHRRSQLSPGSRDLPGA